ncbi:VWA domain-containing protein [bacterium]|nr:VWA domain-containing protein [bacterium]
MFQRLSAPVIGFAHYFLRFRFIPLLSIIFVQASFSTVTSLNVTFNHVSIADTTVFRGIPAQFPYPVLSLITVKDQQNRYVHDLADTTRWLYPTDIAQCGGLVDYIWGTVLEYHDENHSIPPNPDVKQTDSSYMVTEVYDVKEAGASVVLVMDYSGSMGDTVYKAENAAKMLVRQMNPLDRVALVKFDQDVVVCQDFTSDTTVLIEAIEEEYPDRHGTLLWDAIEAAVALFRYEPNEERRHIVVYTDGKDEGSESDYLLCGAHAIRYNVSIYTIGLGNNIESWRLQMLADNTGGRYYHAPKLDDMPGIYLEIMKELQAYYALAHMSTDPFTNGTRRVVDVTLNIEYGVTGRGVGYYYVPYWAPNVTLFKKVESDLYTIEMGDTLYHAVADDTVSYDLQIINTGHGTAANVQVVDFLADSLNVIDFEVEPQLVTVDSIQWIIPRIDPGKSVHLNYQARVSSKMPSEGTILTNTAYVDCVSDSISTDNEAHADLYAYGVPDLTIRCVPSGHISPKHPFKVNAVVKNLGNADVIIPFQVAFFAQELGAQPVDVDSLSFFAVNDSIVVQGLFPGLDPGEYVIDLFADYGEDVVEMNEVNNWDSCHIVVAIDSIAVRISDISYTDQIRGVQGDFPAPVLTKVHVVDQNGKHILGLADTTKWLTISDVNQLGDPVSDVWQKMLEYHKEDPFFPANPNVKPGLRVTEITKSDFSLVFVVDFTSQVSGWSDNLRDGLSGFVDQFTEDDWGAVIGVGNGVEMMQSFTQETTLIKDAFDRLFTENQRHLYDGLYDAVSLANSRSGRQGVLAIVGGEDVGSTITSAEVTDAALERGIPIHFVGLGKGSLTDSLRMLCTESGGWYVELNEGTDTEEGFEAIEHFLRYYFVLSHASPDTIQAQNWRTIDLSVLYDGFTSADKGYYLVPSGPADCAVTKSVITESFSVSDEDTAWFVIPGDTIQYTVHVQNVGHKDVEDVSIEDVLPSNLIPVEFERMPDSVQGSMINWMVDSIPLHESIRFSYRCFVDTLLVSETFTLMNKVTIDCIQDTLLHNNMDSTLVYNIPLKGPDAAIEKVGVGDSLVVVQGDSVWYTFPGKIVEYHVSVVNQGEMICRDMTVQDILPDDVEFIDFAEPSHWVSGDTLRWTINKLDARGGRKEFVYCCQVDTFMPPWVEPLINEATVFCDEDTILWNNSTRDTVWVQGIVPPDPQVRVNPWIVIPGDSVQIEVMTPVDIQSWDLKLRFEDNSEVTDYADGFIQYNPNLEPNSWIVIVPEFGNTWMRTSGEEEMVDVIFETTDLWGVVCTGSARFTLRSADEFLLDENVFRSNKGMPLGMRFRLSSNRIAEIVVYDISGAYVSQVTEGPYRAGWNSTTWDGKDQNGLVVGSGVYVAVLQSGDFKKARKFILVR